MPAITPSALGAMAVRLDPELIPIFSMLVHDTSPAEVAGVLDITGAQLDARRRRIIEQLTHHPRSTHGDHPAFAG
jgi:hypothetical protein